MENQKKANPRKFWIDVVTAAIGSLSDGQLERAADAVSEPGTKFTLEIEHTKTIDNVFHFRRNAYMDVPNVRLAWGMNDFTVN